MALVSFGVPQAANQLDLALLSTGYVSNYKPFKLILYTDAQIKAAQNVWPNSWEEMVIDSRTVQPPEEEDCPLWDLI